METNSAPLEFTLRDGATAVLFACASVISNPAARSQYPECLKRAKAAMTDLLAAARAGGYQHGQILETMLSQGEVSWRTVEMAHTAMKLAGRHRTDLVCQHHDM